MLRIRNIKPEILLDERVAALESDAWRLFASMIFVADDYGNLHADPKLLAAEAFWALERKVDVRPLLDDLVAAELITFYRVRGQSYVSLRGWKKHQKIDRPGKPRVPGPTEADPPDQGEKREVPHTRRATDSRESRETLATDRDRDRDQDRDQDLDTCAEVLADSAPASADPTLLVFPVIRGAGQCPGEWHLTESAAALFREGYPDLDVLAEARKALLWIRVNPRRRKTARGMPAFFNAWLARAQNDGGARPRAAPPKPPTPAASGLCPFHVAVRNANRPAKVHDPTCSECRHVAAMTRQQLSTEPVPIGDVT